MESSKVKRLHPALLVALTVGVIVVIRLGFALLRYTTDLKFAPVFSSYLEEGIKNTWFALVALLVIRYRMAWYCWLLPITIGSLMASVLYRTIAACFGREFYACLNRVATPTIASLLYSLIPGPLLMAIFWAGYAFSRRWK